jgi:hypothetical protein
MAKHPVAARSGETSAPGTTAPVTAGEQARAFLYHLFPGLNPDVAVVADAEMANTTFTARWQRAFWIDILIVVPLAIIFLGSAALYLFGTAILVSLPVDIAVFAALYEAFLIANYRTTPGGYLEGVAYTTRNQDSRPGFFRSAVRSLVKYGPAIILALLIGMVVPLAAILGLVAPLLLSLAGRRRARSSSPLYDVLAGLRLG